MVLYFKTENYEHKNGKKSSKYTYLNKLEEIYFSCVEKANFFKKLGGLEKKRGKSQNKRETEVRKRVKLIKIEMKETIKGNI